MSLNIITGLMGAGKSYVAVNWVLLDELKNGKRDVYTTLPVNIDKIAAEAGGKSPAKQRAIVERIHILEDKEKQPVDASGKPMMKKARIKIGDEWAERETDQPLMLNEARCFWRFTKPNSLIIVDECADYWEAGKAENKKLGIEEGEFGVYLRQHRHYKDDLWMICHNLSDIDPQLRRKFHFVWTVANSRNEPIVDNKWFRNIRWPVQFFIVRQYTAADTKKPMDTHHVNPVARGYELYDSFSAASRLPGKEMPAEDARSADYKPSFLKRVGEFLRACRKVVTLAVFVIGGGYVAFTWILLPALGFGEAAVQTKSREIANRTASRTAARPAPIAPVHANRENGVASPPAGIASSGDSVAADVRSVLGEAVVVGDSVVVKTTPTQFAQLRDVLDRLRNRPVMKIRCAVVDVSNSRLPAFRDFLNSAGGGVTIIGDLASKVTVRLPIDIRAVLDFLAKDEDAEMKLDTIFALPSGEPLTLSSGSVVERPVYVRTQGDNQQDLVTRYDRLQLGLTVKLQPFHFDGKWFLRFDVQDADTTSGTEKRLTMQGAYEFDTAACVQLAAINRTREVVTERRVPGLSRIRGVGRAFTSKSLTKEDRSVMVFLELLP